MKTISLLSIFKTAFNRFSMFLYRHRLLYLCLFIFSVLSVFDIADSSTLKIPTVWKYFFTAAVASLKSSLMMVAVAFMLKNKYTRFLAWALIAIYALLAIINFLCYYFYGFGITRKLILIAAQTTSSELTDFIPQILSNIEFAVASPLLWIALLFLCLLGWIVKSSKYKVFITSVYVVSTLGLASFSYYAANYTSGRTAVSLVVRILKYSGEVAQWNARFKEIQHQKHPLIYEESVNSVHLAKTVVVILGESASRQHLSCYGYPLPTTPFLDSLTDSIFLYKDAIGSSSGTSGNMERILSFKTDDKTTGDGLDYPLLVDVFKKADYKTFWLSNQERTGSVSNTSGVMVMNADVIKYMGAENSEDALSMKFDEILLPALHEALSDPAPYKLIFLHLMGSHVNYFNRYPQDFGVFSADDVLKTTNKSYLSRMMAETVAEYDNSIRYTDYILGEIINSLRNQSDPIIAIYFSDHGENVYDDGPRSGRSDKFVEVPFFVYANNVYSSENPEIVDLLLKSLFKKFSTANFVHQLLTLTGTTYKLYDPTLDVLSPQFIERKRFVDEEEWKYD